jgi:Transposase DDE domain
MATIPQVAHAMREILTTTADDAARTTHFVQRQSRLGGATFSQTLVFGFLSNPQATLEELAQTAATLGVHITPQALDQRFTSAAATCLAQVLQGAIRRVIAADPVAIPLLDRFTAVYLQDSSTIVLPDLLATVWRGCGGSPTARTSAALKLQVRVELRTGHLEDCQLQDGRTPDQRAAFPAGLPAGALRLADLGYWSLEALQRMVQQGTFWLSRLQTQTAVYDSTGQRQDLLALLEAQPTATLEHEVALGADQRVPARLLAVRVPQEVAEARRRRLREAAQDKGRQVSATRLALAAWTLFVTNVPQDRLTLAEALVLGRTRWQIELLFKLWKSHGRVDESRSTKPWRMLCEVYAKLLAMLVQHWVFLVSCWTYPDRSLTKAAQTVQKHALHLASVFASVKRLREALMTVKRCLAAGCRMNRRKKRPNTYQLLIDAIGP